MTKLISTADFKKLASAFFLVAFFAFSASLASAQNLTALKEAQALDGSPLTSLEIGQTYQYRLTWQCSFTNTPPPEQCGDFELTDVLPQGLVFDNCLTTGDYSCTESGGVVTIDKVGGASGQDLGDGDASEAFIAVHLSTVEADYPGGIFPTNINNDAVITSGQPPFTGNSNLPLNPPGDNWEISKSIVVPLPPLNPALDNDAIYRLQLCPNGPAGVGTGTLPLQNAVINDICESGATFVGATLNNMPISPTAPNNTCPNLQFDLGTLSPDDLCQSLDITLQYPSSNFALGEVVENEATATGNGGNVTPCGMPCSATTTQELSAPNPDAKIKKAARRSELSAGAFMVYGITFDTLDSNVLLNNVVVEDIFPAGLDPDFIRMPRWADNTILANIIALPSGNVLLSGYDGDSSQTFSAAGFTGFQIEFTTPIPPGFSTTNSGVIATYVSQTVAIGDVITNCLTMDADELTNASESCAAITIVPPLADVQLSKKMPASVVPAEDFPSVLTFNQDLTSTLGSVNPTIVDCLPAELEFVSWDNVLFSGLDDPRNPVDVSNTSPLGAMPNFEYIPVGDPANTCTTGGPLLRWSWSSTPPVNSLQIDNSPGVANPFTFPVHKDTNGDNAGTPADSSSGTITEVKLLISLRVVAGTPVQSGLVNTLASTSDSNYNCVTAEVADDFDIDSDSDFTEIVCQSTATFAVNSAAGYKAQKFVGGFPGLPNIDPVTPPSNANAATATTPIFCPQDGNGRTRTPCVAQVMAGQPFDYQVRLSNEGNVPLTDYVAYDIMPYANDVGIAESQASSNRGSTWQPTLIGPITISSTNPSVQAELTNNAVFEYSASNNPCRPEVSLASDNNWQSSCVDDWTTIPLADTTTFPNGYASVRAWRLAVPFAGSWPIADPANLLDEDIVLDMPMLAPNNALRSDYDAANMEIAWNNIAHRGTNFATGGRLLAAEARKVGVVLPEDYPISSDGVRIGNLVWLDANNDGVANATEPGILDVTVQLWVDVTGDGPSADDILYDQEQTDALGHYLFDDSDPRGADGLLGTADDIKDNLGMPEGNYYVVIPVDQQGSFNLAQNYSSTGAGVNVDADGNVDNDDNGASDSTGSGIATTDANSPNIEGIYSGVVDLTMGLEPTDEELRDGVATDDDNDFFDDNASNVSVDFGFYQLRLGNHIWLDTGAGALNDNGVADPSEFAIEGMEVELWLDDGDGVFDPALDTQIDADPSTTAIDTVATDANGQYLYEGLDIGNYFAAIPSGQTGLTSNGVTYDSTVIGSSSPTSADPLNDENVDDGEPGIFGGVLYQAVTGLLELDVTLAQTEESDTSNDGVTGSSSTDVTDPNAEFAVNIANNAAFPDTNSFLTVDFSFVGLVSLGSTVWEDSNVNGIQDIGETPIEGAEMTLLDANGIVFDNDPFVAGLQPYTVVTDADGQYNFNDLPPGDYRVQVDVTNVVNGADLFPTPTQVADPDAPGAGQDNNTDSNIDFAYDTNTSDQIHTSGVIALAPNTEPTSESDPIGTPGSDQPNQGLTSTDDSDASGNMAVDFGFIRPVSVGSTLWEDVNVDGVQDITEPSIVGATVTLLNSNGSVFDNDPYTAGIQSLVATTDADGQYNFNSLPAGEYRIQVDLATATNTNVANFIPTIVQVADPDAAGAGQDNNTDSNIDDAFDTNTADQIYTSGIVLLTRNDEPVNEVDPIGVGATATSVDQPNQDLMPDNDPDSSGNMTVDFGFYEPVSLGSTVWFDSDNDGLQTASEPAIAGVTVTLLNADGTVYDTDPATAGIQPYVDVTDADGQYNFNGLPEGDYRVQVDLTTATSHVGGSLLPTPSQVDDPDAAGSGQDNNDDSNIDSAAPGHDPSANVYQSGVVTLEIGSEPTGETDGIGAGGADQPNQGATQPDNNGNMTVDFGFFAPVSLGSTVWQDVDADGTQDATEPAIEGATITLLNADGTVYDSDPNVAGIQPLIDVTDVDGQYNFNDLIPGDYIVQVDLSTVPGGANFIPTPVQVADPDVAGDDNTDSNIDFAADTNVNDQVHTSGVITLAVGQEPANETDPIGVGGADQPNQDLTATADPDDSGNMTVDFGFVLPVSLGSTLWQDTNGDGTQDDNEPPVEGATVTLLNADGTVFDSDPYTPGIQPLTVLSDAEGQYNFNDLPPGDYRVQVDVTTVTNGTAFVPTPTQVADPDNNDNSDSNIDVSAPGHNPANGLYQSGVVTLTPGGEPTVETDPIDGIDGNSAVTDQPGQTTANPDDSGNMTVDFGFIAPVSIGSLVWDDLNGDGLQDSNEPPVSGAQMTLLVDDGTGTFVPATDLSGALIPSQTTGLNGLYFFDDLTPGDYIVQVTPPSGLFLTPIQNGVDDDDTENDSNVNLASTSALPAGTFESGVFTLESGAEPAETDVERGDNQDSVTANSPLDLSGNMTVDFGFVQPASIGDRVWLDLNMDGIQDATENPISGVTVSLTPPPGIDIGAGAGNPITTTTDANGNYLFPNLPPYINADPTIGYVVTVDSTTLPAGYGQTFDEGDGVGATDHTSDPIQLDPSEAHLTADFGYVPADGSIGDTIWIDANGDGVQDPSESGIPGVTVTLIPAPNVDLGNGVGVPVMTVTDANGMYLFTGLPLDEVYQVIVDETTLPAGFTSDPDGDGDPDVRAGSATSADGETVIVLTSEDTINLGADFGYLPPAGQNNSVGDTVWFDVDGDGVQNNGENGLAGVTIDLIDASTGSVIASTVTDANGNYLFTGVPDGMYDVVVTDTNGVLTNFVQTFDADGTVTPNVSTVDLDSAGTSSTPVDDLDQDFGYEPPATIGGDGVIGDTVFFDSNNDGLPDPGEGVQSVVVELFDANGNLVASTVTDANGNYLFTGLDTSATGETYSVVVDTSTLPNGGAGWGNTVDPDGANDSTSVVTLTDAAPENLDQDFGYLGNDNNTISGTVWSDTDGDGQQSESGNFAGVTIELLDSNGNVIATTVTDANGDYSFTGLPDGVYSVVVTDVNNVLASYDHTDSPNGASDTSDNTSKDDTGYVVDLDSSGSSSTPVTNPTGDFGYMPLVTNPISLASYKAERAGKQVSIRWTTQTEVGNLGFFLYAKNGNGWDRLNAELIPGKGDSTRVQAYTAEFTTQADYFAISDIDLYGKETVHGPFKIGLQHGAEVERKAIDWTKTSSPVSSDVNKSAIQQSHLVIDREALKRQQMLNRNAVQQQGGQ